MVQHLYSARKTVMRAVFVVAHLSLVQGKVLVVRGFKPLFSNRRMMSGYNGLRLLYSFLL